MTNTKALKERIKDQGLTFVYVAKELNITREALYGKLYDKSEFKASEILTLRNLLRLSPEESDAIFFTELGE